MSNHEKLCGDSLCCDKCAENPACALQCAPRTALTAAQTRVAELEGALRFYADSKGYNVSEVYSGGEFQGCKHGDAITDKGRRARQALMGGANNG